MILSSFVILVCTSLPIVVCSSVVDFHTAISIVNKYYFYKTTAAISGLLIHNAMGPVLEPSPSEGEVKPATRNWHAMWSPWYVDTLLIPSKIPYKPSYSTTLPSASRYRVAAQHLTSKNQMISGVISQK